MKTQDKPRHSPFPWEPRKARTGWHIRSGPDEAGLVTSVYQGQHGDKDRTEADARLISATPEAIAACQMLLAGEPLEKVVQMAKLALLRANLPTPEGK